jgi:hypothetical protein
MGWCPLRHVAYLKRLLIRAGLMVRVAGPRQVMAGLERLVRLQAEVVTGSVGSAGSTSSVGSAGSTSSVGSAGSTSSVGSAGSSNAGSVGNSSGTGRGGSDGRGSSSEVGAAVADGSEGSQVAALGSAVLGQQQLQQPLWLSVASAVAARGSEQQGSGGVGPGPGLAGLAAEGDADWLLVMGARRAGDEASVDSLVELLLRAAVSR